jgi:cytochrome c oxidase subunit 2
VCAIVIGALVALVRHRRPAERDVPLSALEAMELEGNRTVVLLGMVIPALVITLTLGYTIYTLRAVADGGSSHGDHSQPKPAVAGSSTQLEVAGTQWWWRVSYPAEQVVTANEIHVPAGVRTHVTVLSEDVIHSFWIPQVAGKLDMIPGKTNTLSFQVDRPGVYRGLCAEFCGLQHAHMHTRLIVQPPDVFAAWLAGQQRPAAPPSEPLQQAGQQIFLSARCGECHTVRGTPAGGSRGPDLTHLASRSTLGAGAHDNTRGNLRGWIVDPQAMKPGNKMPATQLAEPDLQALLSYLEGLE